MRQIPESPNPSRFARLVQPYRVMFNIAFRQMFWSKKTLLLSIVAVLPALVAISFRFSEHSVRDAKEVFPTIMLVMYLLFLSILLALFYGTAIVADEVDNKTIIYLFTRPIRKYTILFGKFIAYLLGTCSVLIPSALITFAILVTDSKMKYSFGENLGLFLKYLIVLVLALIAYGAIFTLFGISLKRPVLIGLLFAFGWEKITLIVPGFIKKFSVVHYLLSSFPHDRIPPRKIKELFHGTTIRPVSSIFILLLISLVFLGLSIWIFSRKEYRV